ncbi:unnamed protein product [Paramecium sonneborni]|uniref:Uncharacterized protein n=1 Tax=Paramecium sonneborni TaxID=65129 RepID=A0A8S1P065_9CILI|nr:unnamed protein product [Paramecium sonneborni]
MVLITIIRVLFTDIPFYLWLNQLSENHFPRIPSEWKLINPYSSNQYINCAGKDVYGGFNIFFGSSQIIGNFFNFPIHTHMRVNFTIYYIDSWDNHTLTLQLDNNYYFYSKDYYTERYDLCGSSLWKDDFEQVSIVQLHKDNSLTVSMRVNLDQAPDDESYGFREFTIELNVYYNCAEFYTECNFQGQVIKICNRQPNLTRSSQPTQIKSVRVPVRGRVILQSINYGKLELTEDLNCINEFTFPKYIP